ncbi:MAG: hypothetical protein FJY25_17440 [Betaproteobacteria bacterium]|nr:hypothetical protein [Betaproteobacteria bacterium]
MKQLSRTLIAAVAVIPLALAGCGGGGSGSSSPGVAGANGGTLQAASTELATGIITGFGSVYVDGVRLDDSDIGAVSEQADGTTRPAVLQLGQRVRASHDGAGKAVRLVVDAAVIGQVTQIDSVQGSVQVAGQRVLVNADPSAGIVTQFGGFDATEAGRYSSLADVRSGDLAEVHGSPVLESGKWVVRATRIDKRNTIGSVRVVGAISDLVNTEQGKTFKIGGLTVDFGAALSAGKVRPAARLANGVMVNVQGASTGVVNDSLTAQAVQVGRERDELPATTRVQLGGVVSGRDVSAGTFQVDGARVRIGSVSPEPTGAVVNDGSWVKVDGALAADGAVEASRITVRQSNLSTDLARVRLIGPVSGLVDQDTFIVRDVPVDASAVLAANRTGCTQIADGTLVTLSAAMQAGTDVVLASELKCETPPANRVVAGHTGGVVATIDVTAKTLTVTDREGQSRTIRWNDATVFVGPTLNNASALEVGLIVQAEGMLDGTTLVAKVIGQHGARPTDRFRERPPMATGQQANRAELIENWTAYRRRPLSR